MPTHCVLRVIYPVSWMGRVPLQRLQINPQMVASVVALAVALAAALAAEWHREPVSRSDQALV
jgi:hypothetical protein